MPKSETQPASPAPATPVDDSLTLTKTELQKLIDENRAEAEQSAMSKLEKDRDKEKADAAAEEARKKGEWEKVANDEKTAREKSDERAASAERRAQLAEVNVALRDHLATTHAEYLANAADIMLHVEKKLDPKAKPDEVTKLIQDEAKAFVDRTPREKSKGSAGAPPAGPGVNRITQNIKPNTERPVRNRWSTLNYR